MKDEDILKELSKQKAARSQRRKRAKERAEKYERLARLAIQSTHWKWLEGMLVACHDWQGTYRLNNPGIPLSIQREDIFPDLGDPSGATIGCLYALVRQAYKSPDVYFFKKQIEDNEFWQVAVLLDGVEEIVGEGGSLIESLVHSLTKDCVCMTNSSSKQALSPHSS